MLGFLSKNERSQMSIDASMTMREYAGRRWPAINHKGRMTRLAGVLGFGHRRVRSIYQNEPTVRLRADEMAAIAALRREEANDAVGASQAEYRALEARIAALEGMFRAGDEEFGVSHMDALRQSAPGQGGIASSRGGRNGPSGR